MKDKKRKPFRAAIPALALVLAGVLGAAMPAPAAAAPTGHLYGRVTTDSGNTYLGVLRWGNEEAFWDDHFNSSKDELPYMDSHRDGEHRNHRTFRVFGKTFSISDENGWRRGRQFITRFGAIDRIDVHREDEATIHLKGGTSIEVDGGANDVSAKIAVLDASLGEVEVQWKKIATIQFLPTPADLEPAAYRIHGTVSTRDGELRGFIQWDSQECLSSDKIDGESEDSDLSIEMGRIRTIERRSSRSSRLVLKDGREMILKGTNDVNDDIRGILVEDPRYGRVKVPWDEFERVVFDDPDGRTGNAYGDYDPARPLTGTVVDRTGKSHRGRIVYDLDEAWDWEFLNGDDRDVEYAIPFALISTLQREGSRATRVTLKSGLTLTLEGSADVSEDNAGILILPTEGSGEVYLPWLQVDRIELD